MKILLVIADITCGGGAERVVSNLANSLSEHNFEVEILSFYKENDKLPYDIDPRIKIDFLHSCSRKFIFENNKFYKLYYKHYESFILKKRYKDFDVMIYNNCPQFPFFKNKKTYYIKIMHEIFKKRHQMRNGFFDCIVTLTSNELQIYKKYHKNIIKIPNFLPELNKTQIDFNAKQKIVLSIGRMSSNDEKRFISLLDIWQMIQEDESYKEWKLHIVGEGEFKSEIKTAIINKKLENSVILKPFTEKINEEYQAASIYAMTSKQESFGMVLIESANYGLASIAFDVNSGPRDIIENQKTGFLVKNDDTKTYIEKLKELMRDENLRKTMGLNAKKRVKTHFSKEKIMQQWLELFENIIQNS